MCRDGRLTHIPHIMCSILVVILEAWCIQVGQDMCPTQGFGFGNVATGQVVQKKVEFLQRAGSVGRGDSRDGLNPDIRSDEIIMPRSRPLVNVGATG